MAKVLRLPVAKLGSWFHESKGLISFSEEDLAAIERNFNVNARGYEPYVRDGHNEQGAGIYDNEKARAHMFAVKREGDVLFGYFEPNDEKVVDEVESVVSRRGKAKHCVTGPVFEH